ncbi:MAG: lamin tail domain-containing protein [Patescibacteria group bacterium]|nr:lamin tail domain-containing protein [Patescibacteria group bacterium]
MGRKAIVYFGLFGFFLLANIIFLNKVSALESDLLFSEIMYDVPGSDSGQEWVEVYNAGQEEIIVTSSWRFFDSAKHILNLVQGTSTIASGEFFILADNTTNFLVAYPDYSGTLFDTVISLPNTSSTIYLSFDSGATYPIEASYNSAWGGSGNGYSLEKVILSQDSSQSNWQESSILGGTPGWPNSEPSNDPPDEEDPPEDDNPSDDLPDQNIQASWAQIIISEFLPNPVGSDDYEWIELYNRGPLAVDLIGFGLSDDTTRVFILAPSNVENIILEPYQFIVFYRQTTKIALNNSGGDSVQLYDPLGNILEIVEYRESAPEGKSYGRENNQFFWTKILTPGQANQISRNQNPIAQIAVSGEKFVVGEKIEFSATGSSDPEGDELDYQWDFGDSGKSTKEIIKYAYKQAGAYTVILTVKDSEGGTGETRYSLNIKVEEKADSAKDEGKKASESKIIFEPDFNVDDFFISEFLPNPIGSDDYEWIELYNASNKEIDLFLWQVDDIEGGSKPYVFSTSTILAGNSFLILERQISKIALNNDSDSVRLLTPVGDLWQEVKYEKIPEGKSYAWDLENKEWRVLDEPSPGQANYFLVLIDQASAVLAGFELAAMAKNSSVQIEGVVLRDYIKGESSLYLADYSQGQPDFEELIEVYCYYKDFPALQAGQVVLVSGQLTRNEAIVRVKIKNQSDITLSGKKINLAPSDLLLVEDLDSGQLNSFVSVKGLVVKKSGKNIYLASQAGGDYLVRVYAKYGWGDWEIKKGLTIVASGILTELDNAFKLSPLSDKDIALAEEVLGEKIEEDIAVLENSRVFESSQPAGAKKKVWIFVLGGAGLLAGVYFFKKRKTEVE